jgi:hypothetical protein
VVEVAEFALRYGVSLFSRGAVPAGSFGEIDRDSFSLFKEVTQPLLGCGVALKGSSADERIGLGIVLGNAQSVFVERSEIELRGGVARVRGQGEPSGGLLIVALDTFAEGVGESQIVLAERVSSLSGSPYLVDRLSKGRIVIFEGRSR